MAKTRALINKKTFAFILVMTVITAGSWASDLAVKAGAAKSGSFGLEVTVGSTCSGDADLVVPDQTVGGTTSFEGCLTLTAANVDVLSSGDVTLRAGDSIAIQNGFSVASSGNLTLAIDSRFDRAGLCSGQLAVSGAAVSRAFLRRSFEPQSGQRSTPSIISPHMAAAVRSSSIFGSKTAVQISLWSPAHATVGPSRASQRIPASRAPISPSSSSGRLRTPV